MNLTKCLLQILGWGFFLVAIASVILYIEGILDNLTIAPTCAALFGIFLNESSKLAEKQKHQSKFLLEKSLIGFDHSIKLLANRNNNRSKWISAARTLQQSLEISTKITEDEHKNILQIETDRYRHQLWEILNPYDEKITPAFFYGANDPSLDIDEAARQATIPRSGEPLSRFSSTHYLSEQSLCTIWNFMRFPEDYVDLACNKFSLEEIEKLRLKHPPLHEYLKHKCTYSSIGGQCLKKE